MHQENEIGILKSNLSSILNVLSKQQPNTLENDIETGSVNNNFEMDTSPAKRRVRPARLLPLQLINGYGQQVIFLFVKISKLHYFFSTLKSASAGLEMKHPMKFGK